MTSALAKYARAEHGGHFQAVATGIHEKHGLDVSIKMGGPQVNAVQRLAAGQADFTVGNDFQVLSGIEQGVPMVTAGASFQKAPQGIVTHTTLTAWLPQTDGVSA
ncbi:ABC transporter substrate-binding protein [Sorangium sp. So ce216]